MRLEHCTLKSLHTALQTTNPCTPALTEEIRLLRLSLCCFSHNDVSSFLYHGPVLFTFAGQFDVFEAPYNVIARPTQTSGSVFEVRIFRHTHVMGNNQTAVLNNVQL